MMGVLEQGKTKEENNRVRADKLPKFPVFFHVPEAE
jgi:hypothetical protein